MKMQRMALVLCFLFFFFISSTSACDRCVRPAKAAYFSSSSGLSHGACGYGSLAIGFQAGHLAAAAPSLYKNGAACGTCLQMRCKNATLCTNGGTTVTVTDINVGNKTEFVLSSRAFRAMANKGMDIDILQRGIVDVEYKRVPCIYKGKNLAIRVEEYSNPYYLAIKFLYLGGQTEILALDVAPVGSSNTQFMSRNYGAVWDTGRVPKGPLLFRLIVKSGFDTARIWTTKPLPADWKNGYIYDTGVQITDIAKESDPCPDGCDDGSW